MAALSKEEISSRLSQMPGWSLSGDVIQRKYSFKAFLQAIEFVNAIAKAAEQANHHPDITINYNQVTISLSTHSESGITDKDFQLAAAIDKIYPEKR